VGYDMMLAWPSSWHDASKYSETENESKSMPSSSRTSLLLIEHDSRVAGRRQNDVSEGCVFTYNDIC
jgi:hypothetical protein